MAQGVSGMTPLSKGLRPPYEIRNYLTQYPQGALRSPC